MTTPKTSPTKTTKAKTTKAKTSPSSPAVMPATWRALRTALPRKARAAVVRSFMGGTPTAEDVLALELGVLAVLMTDTTKNARFLAAHLRHIATLSAQIRDEQRRAKLSAAHGVAW